MWAGGCGTSAPQRGRAVRLDVEVVALRAVSLGAALAMLRLLRLVALGASALEGYVELDRAQAP